MRQDQQQTVLRKLFLTFSSLKYQVAGSWIFFRKRSYWYRGIEPRR